MISLVSARGAFLTGIVVCGAAVCGISSQAFAASGGMDLSHQYSSYAWSSNDGWLNWGTSQGNVQVSDTAVTGYVWDQNTGWINLAPTNGGVTNNGTGTLGGYAWGAGVGWINFSGVTIDAQGVFHGTASGVGIGSINFDCSTCWVQTYWRPTTTTSITTTITSGGGTPYTPAPSQVPSTTPGVQPTPTPTPTPTPIVYPKPNPAIQPITRPSQTPTVLPSRNPQPPTSVQTKPATKTENDHVYAYNQSLVMTPRQSGTLTYDVPSGGQVTIEVPKGASTSSDDLVIAVAINTTRVQDTAKGFLNSMTYEVTAYMRKSGARVHTFAKPLTITLPTGHLRGKKIQTFTKDTLDQQWQSVPNTVVNDAGVTFSVMHLSYFLLIAPADQIAPVSTTSTHIPSQDGGTCDSLFAPIDPILTPWYFSMFGCVWWPIIVVLLLVLALIVSAIYRTLSRNSRATNFAKPNFAMRPPSIPPVQNPSDTNKSTT